MLVSYCFFLKDTATTEHYTYGHTRSLHDALPIFRSAGACVRRDPRRRSVPSWRGQRRIAGWGSGWGGHPVSDGTKHSGHRVNCRPTFSLESTMSEQDPRPLPVLLSGGSGTRLRPLSPRAYPNQFLPLAAAAP